MILYKYRDNSPRTEQILTDRSVWLAKSSSLNDPCECSLHSLAPEWLEDRIRKMKAAQMMGIAQSFNKAPRPIRRALKRNVRKAKTFDEQYRIVRHAYEEQFSARLSKPEDTFAEIEGRLRDIGVFSLSEVSHHPLMWSHYGENHFGVCLGFEILEQDSRLESPCLLQVRYSDHLPRLEEGFIQEMAFSLDAAGRRVTKGQISLVDPAMRAAIGTKAQCWEYEREWRYIAPQSGAYPFPGPLVEMIFGFRCPVDQRKHYLELVGSHISNTIRVFEMRRINDSYTFERVLMDELPVQNRSASVV